MSSQPGKTILIVEDNPGDQLLLTELLKLSKLSIQELVYAGRLSEALPLIEQKNPHIILLDLSLPDSSGMETYLAVKNFNHRIPVIILSGLADMALAMKAIQEGAQDYLVKDDFDERLLAKTIRYSIERKNNLEILRLSNERYDHVIRATNDMIWDWDVSKEEIDRNEEQFVKMLKLPPALRTGSGEFWLSLLHPEDRPVLESILQNIFNDRQQSVFETEYRILRGDNVYIHVYDRGQIIRDENGHPRRLIGATRDISDKKKADEELRRLSMIAKETVNAVIVTDASGKIEWVNEAFSRITGYAREEVMGRKPGDFLQGPETNAETIEYMRGHIAAWQPFSCEVLNYSRQGRPYWIKIQGQPMLDGAGKLVNYFAIETDITQRKLAEAALRKSEDQYRNLFDNNPASIIIWDLENFAIMEVNETAMQTYGYTRTEFLAMRTLALRSPEDIPRIQAFSQQALTDVGFKATSVWRHLSKNGEVMFMQISSHRIVFNERPAMLSISINITEKMELERRLAEEREERARELTQAVITAQENEREEIGRELHDNINQLLASSRLYLGLAKSDWERNSTYADETDRLILNAIEEIRGLSHALIPPALVGDEFIDALDNILQIATAGTGIRVHKTMEGLNTEILPGKLQLTIYRIIQEQFNNIIKHAGARNVWIILQQQGDRVQLNIKDDGRGCDLADKSGGVGLMNIRTRASYFNGVVKMKSAPGQGFELEVCFNCE